jgi:hypothetical protein
LTRYGVEDREGRYVLPVRDGEYGAALFRYAQALMEIAGVAATVQRTERPGGAD